MVNAIQGLQAPCVFFDIVATQKFGFIWLESWVNIASSYAKNALIVIADIVKLAAYKKKVGKLLFYRSIWLYEI